MSLRTPIWLFDLDNTLHDASHAIFPAITRNMNGYMAALLGDGNTPADAETVNAVRQLYWQRYGATLMGLVKHHGVRADEFLREAHRFDDLPSMIRAERGLARLFKRLPGRKILLTNAPRQYSHQVLRHLGLHRHFAQHVPIEAMRVHGKLQPKPSRQFLRKLMAQLGVHARDCILVEDTVTNLRAAKQVGMRTALVTRYSLQGEHKNSAACADVTVKSVLHLTRHGRQLHRTSL
ncbi:MAG: pyrimidine 5'-nucleotidase [Undibacterium sp.]|uniref:pyrimidine 5'-nucleotidase n=1 Tax=Undibacterium sp. TaxID=1914977 RepID=UPI00271B1258|nr:pyrimidine 5'-nucleotidase [Undibacterium sp.]MDO8650678.1 pyrimidine 5'-nucleotidase [Undibacterium sp.]